MKQRTQSYDINPASTSGLVKAVRISPIFINLVILGLAIWAVYEAFQSNYFTNSNPGSKTFSVAILANSILVLLLVAGIGVTANLKSAAAPILILGLAITFFHVVYLLNVWKVNGVIVTKETDSALTFIKVWSILVLVGSAWNMLSASYNVSKRSKY